MGKVWGEQKSKFHIDTPDSVCDTQSENYHQTRPVTARLSRACWSVTSANPKQYGCKIPGPKGPGIFLCDGLHGWRKEAARVGQIKYNKLRKLKKV